MVRQEPLPDLRAGAPVGEVVLTWYGRRYSLEFLVPGDVGQRRPRSDLVAVEIDGEWRRMSLRAALLELDRMAPRMAARREREIQEGKRCPDCASEDTESNGSTEYRCRECDHRWGFEGGRSGEPYGFC